jgi:glycosyltransferase involved in cell wall biosynthesis
MILNRRLVVIMPAYNAEKTLRETYADLPQEYADEAILVDDASTDKTARVSRELRAGFSS